MTDPQRAERLWLVISIGLLWLTTIGEAAFDALHWHCLNTTSSHGKSLSAPLFGWIQIVVALLKGQPFPTGYLHPYAWDAIPLTDTYP